MALAPDTAMAKDATLLRPRGSVTVRVTTQRLFTFGAVKIASEAEGLVSVPAVSVLNPMLPQAAAQVNVSSAVSPASGS